MPGQVTENQLVFDEAGEFPLSSHPSDAYGLPHALPVSCVLGNQLFGLDAEIYLKMEAKRDRVWERSVLEW